MDSNSGAKYVLIKTEWREYIVRYLNQNMHSSTLMKNIKSNRLPTESKQKPCKLQVLSHIYHPHYRRFSISGRCNIVKINVVSGLCLELTGCNSIEDFLSVYCSNLMESIALFNGLDYSGKYLGNF
jgi:hypothetical protein